jgi:putative transposase
VIPFILALLAAARVFFRSRHDTALEIVALRQQVAVLKRTRPSSLLECLNHLDRLFWTTLRRVWFRWAEVLVVIKPETVVDWPPQGFPRILLDVEDPQG